MSIVEKPNSPYLHIDFRVDGIRYAFSSQTASYAEAFRIQSRAQAEARRRSVPKSRLRKDMSFDEAAFQYWNDQGQSTRDADNLKGNLYRTVLMVGADTMCSDIDFEAMVGFRRELRKGLPEIDTSRGRKTATEGEYKAKTINKYLGLVFTTLNHAERILKTQFPDKPRPSDKDEDGMGLLELTQPRARYLMKHEEDALERVCREANELDLLDMWKADLELGLREVNLCDAAWKNYDPHEKLLTVFIKSRGRDPRPHQVKVNKKALEILTRRKDRKDKHPEFIFTLPSRKKSWLDEDSRAKGEQIPVLPSLLYSRMKEMLKEAGIENFIVHDLRRTAARRVYMDKDLHAARVFLGHRDLETTADYIGLLPSEIDDVRRHSLENRAKRRH